AEFLVVPEDVALRVSSLSEETIGQTNGFDGFAVEDGADLDAGLLLKILENRLGIDLILGSVNHNGFRRRLVVAGGFKYEQEERDQDHKRKQPPELCDYPGPT